MRIAQIAHASVGGSTRIAVDLARILANRRHSVHFFAVSPVAALSGSSVTLHWLSNGNTGRFSPRLDKDWPERRVEAFAEMLAAASASARLNVVHFHYALPFARVAARVRALLPGQCPLLVMTLHGTDVSGLKGSEVPRMSEVLSAVDVLTTVSASHASLIAEKLGLRSPTVIPNFVDLGRFRPLSTSSDGRTQTPRRLRIAYVSNFRPVKNAAAAARVFAEVARRLDAELWLIGDGEHLPAVRRILRSRHLLDRVRFCGLRPDVHRFLRRTDLLLVTSHAESFGLAALEALACGVPVVAPRIGGLPEVVADGSTGILFHPGDEQSAAAAVESILTDAGLFAAMRRAARHRACSFAGDVVVEQYERLYRRAVAGNPGVAESSGEQVPPAARPRRVPAGVSVARVCAR